MLDFATADSGQLELESLVLEPAQVVRSVVEICRPAAQAKGLRLSAEIDPGLPTTAYGDPGRVSQVLANLVNNAVKFTAVGEVRVRARAAAVSDDGLLLQVTVQDTGIGIAPDVQQTLFQAFVQGDSSTTRRYGGAGLGLAISRRLVELMGGEIDVTSEHSRGSMFRFTVLLGLLPGTIPVVSRPVPPIGSERGDAFPPPAPVQPDRVRLLLVEDNPMNQRVVTLMTERLGYDIDVVADGFEATGRIRPLGGEPGKTPIVALTASAYAADRQRCLDAGMNDFLAKPITFGLFASTLARWLED